MIIAERPVVDRINEDVARLLALNQVDFTEQYRLHVENGDERRALFTVYDTRNYRLPADIAGEVVRWAEVEMVEHELLLYGKDIRIGACLSNSEDIGSGLVQPRYLALWGLARNTVAERPAITSSAQFEIFANRVRNVPNVNGLVVASNI